MAKKQTAVSVAKATETQVTPEVAEKVKAFFESNPNVPEVYSTPDGYLFTVFKFAQNHALTLEAQPETHSNPNNATEAETTEE
jgi:hypothetical protein